MSDNKHSASDLRQMQSLPLEAKIAMSQRRIKEWYDHWDGQVYVSFSGGKDSTVLKHLVENTPGVYDVPSLFINTGLEFPEIQKFATSQPNVITVRPEMRFDEVIKKYGYPVISKEVSKRVHWGRKYINENGRVGEWAYKSLTQPIYTKDGKLSPYDEHKYEFLLDAPFKISDQCCKIMKKDTAHKYGEQTGRKPIIATMACESQMRRTSWLKNGCNAFGAVNPASTPMSFWIEQDVLHYIKKFNLTYCSVYGDIIVDTAADIPEEQTNIIDYLGDYEEDDILKTTGYARTGCIFCMFGCHLEKEPTRFQRLKGTHPRQYNYCINGGEFVDGKWQPNKEGLGLGYVLDYIGVKYK